ncbi:hypothetical protein [Kitasatospora sp. MAA4]|uniref:hypothetical protein n=1 Tax=Kitasatospora sp. MAA4 TaxID=3035093 RepID=UPI0024740590|nr:hypothetical protein [Kitasatospora sp. MAA4]
MAALTASVCGSTLPASAAVPSAASRTAPVQACQGQSNGPGLPPLKALSGTVPVPDPINLPPTAAVFGASYPGDAQYLVAPSGWTCDTVFFSADGGEQAFVHPGASVADPLSAQFSSVVQAVFNSGGVQTNVDLACPFVPQATAPATPGGQPGNCTAPPRQSADRVHAVATGNPGLSVAAIGVPSGVREPNLPVTTQAPPTGPGSPGNPVVALVVLQGPQGTAQEVTCSLPKATATAGCQATLGYFLANSPVGQQMSSTDLANAVADLNNFISAFVG